MSTSNTPDKQPFRLIDQDLTLVDIHAASRPDVDAHLFMEIIPDMLNLRVHLQTQHGLSALEANAALGYIGSMILALVSNPDLLNQPLRAFIPQDYLESILQQRSQIEALRTKQAAGEDIGADVEKHLQRALERAQQSLLAVMPTPKSVH